MSAETSTPTSTQSVKDAPADAGETTRAAGSSFYLAMRILPRARRQGMFEIYAFCRRVDDIADSDLPRPRRVEWLARWRADIEAIYAGHAPERLRGLANTVRDFSLEKQDFLAIIDGMEMDAAADIHAPDWNMLDLYCDRVASAVGRLSVKVFGMARDDGRALAHHLGRALQLTNILRDVDEDAEINRLYLPAEALRDAGIQTSDPRAAIAHPNLAAACAPVVDRARSHFAEADRIMRRSPRWAVRAPRLMERVYRKILRQMEARGWAPPRTRLRPGKLWLIGIALRYAIV